MCGGRFLRKAGSSMEEVHLYPLREMLLGHPFIIPLPELPCDVSALPGNRGEKPFGGRGNRNYLVASTHERLAH